MHCRFFLQIIQLSLLKDSDVISLPLRVSIVFQSGPFPLIDNHMADEYWYTVTMVTGHFASSGTTADIFIVIKGNEGESAPRKLSNPHAKCFQKGETNVFLLAFPSSLGTIHQIQVWHDNGGGSPGWFTLETQAARFQTGSDFFCQNVHSFGLLQCNINIRRFFLSFLVELVQVEFFR